jgi:hypothetical protein
MTSPNIKLKPVFNNKPLPQYSCKYCNNWKRDTTASPWGNCTLSGMPKSKAYNFFGHGCNYHSQLLATRPRFKISETSEQLILS